MKTLSIAILISLSNLAFGIDDPISTARQYNGKTGKVSAYQSQKSGAENDRSRLGQPCTIVIEDDSTEFPKVIIQTEGSNWAQFRFAAENEGVGRSNDGTITVVTNQNQEVAFSGCGQGMFHASRGPKTFKSTIKFKPNSVEYTREYTCKARDFRGPIETGPFVEKTVCKF